MDVSERRMCWQELRPLSVPDDFKLSQLYERDIWDIFQIKKYGIISGQKYMFVEEPPTDTNF